LLRLLEQQPAWRDALRAALLGEEFTELPKLVQELVRAQRATSRQIRALTEAQVRTEERVGRLEAAVERLAEAQARTEERVGRLEAAVERLAEAQARTEERVGRLEAAVERLAEAQARTEERVGRLEVVVERLAEAQARTQEELRALVREVTGLKDDVARLKGTDLQRTYRERAAQYFQAVLRRIRVLDHQQLADLLDDAVDAGRVTLQEKEQVLQCDVAVVGRRDGEQVYLLAEVSSVVDRQDVQRARDRASILERATGLPVLSAAAGNHATAGAREEAKASGVWLILDGRAEGP